MIDDEPHLQLLGRPGRPAPARPRGGPARPRRAARRRHVDPRDQPPLEDVRGDPRHGRGRHPPAGRRSPTNYQVLFLQGGASLQFSMVPMNLLTAGRTADYIDDRRLGGEGGQGGRRVGTVNVAARPRPTTTPGSRTEAECQLTPGRGLRPHDVEQHDRGHRVAAPARRRRRAARQRHLVGHVQPPDRRDPLRPDLRRRPEEPRAVRRRPSCIIREDLLARSAKSLPTMLNYAVQAENDSLYNTPPDVRHLRPRPRRRSG